MHSAREGRLRSVCVMNLGAAQLSTQGPPLCRTRWITRLKAHSIQYHLGHPEISVSTAHRATTYAEVAAGRHVL